MTLDTTNITAGQLLDGYTLNLTSDGVCTSNEPSDCVVISNFTAGTIINPVRSARINTSGKKTITYGRVEVVAKMPAGDWLWPAIWYAAECYLSLISSFLSLPLFSLDTLHSGPLTLHFLPQDVTSRLRLWRVAKKWRG